MEGPEIGPILTTNIESFGLKMNVKNLASGGVFLCLNAVVLRPEEVWFLSTSKNYSSKK